MATHIIGIADYKIGRGGDILTTLGLGSCVGVTLYDPSTKIGGLVHIMLPEYNGQIDQNRIKFADTGIMDMYNKLCMSGARKANFSAKLAGGAHMFAGTGNNNFLKIGERNVEACKKVLGGLRIPIIANDTGGTHGRTIELFTDSGKLKIRTVGFGEKFI